MIVVDSSWCLTCKGLAKSLCHQAKHKVTNFMKSVEEFDGWLGEAENGVNEANGKWDQGWQLLNKFKAVDSLLEEFNKGKEKLYLMAATCEEMKLLPPSIKSSVFMRKNLRQTIADVKKEVQKAEEFLTRIASLNLEAKVFNYRY